MKLSKKLLSIVLAVCLLATIVGIMPITALADTENEPPEISQEQGEPVGEEATEEPEEEPSEEPTEELTEEPIDEEIEDLIEEETEAPSEEPSEAPSEEPAQATETPSEEPSAEPSAEPSEEPVNKEFTAALSADTAYPEDKVTVSGQTIGATDTVTVSVFGEDYKTEAKDGDYSIDIQVPGKDEMAGKYAVEVTDGVSTVKLTLEVQERPMDRSLAKGAGDPDVSISLLNAIKHSDDDEADGVAMAFITKVTVADLGEGTTATLYMKVGKADEFDWAAGISNVTVKYAAYVKNIPAANKSTLITTVVRAVVSDVQVASENITASWNSATDIKDYADSDDLTAAVQTMTSIWDPNWSN